MPEQPQSIKLNNNANRQIESLAPALLWILSFYLPTILLSLVFVIYAQNSSTIGDIESWFVDGDTTSIFTLLLSLSTLPLLLIATSKSRVGSRAVFLGLSSELRFSEFKPWLIISMLYLLLSYWFSFEMQFETPPWMQSLLASTDYLLLSILAICVVAPITEELVFRGFIYAKLARTIAGNSGAIIITSLLFTVIHTQYSFWVQLDLLILAFILSLVRYKTNNLKFCMLIHCLNNSFAFYMLYR